jgi:hypothetical protein
MFYRLAADTVFILHLAFIVFVVLGGCLCWRWPRVVWAHGPAALYGVSIMLVGWICPLTPLENSLRERAGQQGFEGGFIEHYIVPLIYPAGLTRGMQITLGAGLVLLLGLSYGRTLWARRRKKNATRACQSIP